MKLLTGQIIGLNTDQKASLAFSAIRDENAFFALLDLTCDDAFTKGRQTLSDLADFYFDLEGTPTDKLTASFSECEKKLQGDDFNLSIASISGKVLYLMGEGEAQMYLKREGKISPLLSVGEQKQVISGFLQEGDRLLYVAKTLIELIADDLGRYLDLPTDSFEEEIISRVGSSNLESGGLAGLLIEVVRETPSELIPSISKSDDFPKSSPENSYELFDNESGVKKILPHVNKLFKKITSLTSLFPKSGRGRVIIAVVLMLIIASGLVYKFKTSKDSQKNAEFAQFISQSRDNFNAAKNLSTLNPTEAKNKLDSARDQVGKALALKPKDTDANNLKKEIDDNSGSILQELEVSQFPIFLDMDLVKKNFRAEKMSLSAGKILIMDLGVKTLVSVDIAKKSNQILAGSEQLGEALAASINGGLAFVFSKDKGVIKIDTTNQKLSEVAKVDSELVSIIDIYAFAGNIYILDSGGKIWKYLPAAETYSDKREYLTQDTKADFSNAIRMQIESSVYVLKKDGEMLRFTKGAKDNFGYEGLDKGVKDPKSFFVSSDTDNLYLLDSGNSRLLILTKTGSYKGQLSGEKFASASDLVVDEIGKKVYLLEGSKIYSVDLK